MIDSSLNIIACLLTMVLCFEDSAFKSKVKIVYALIVTFIIWRIAI